MIRLAISLAINVVAFALMAEIVRGIGFGGGSPARLVLAAILTAIALTSVGALVGRIPRRRRGSGGSLPSRSWGPWSVRHACSG